MEAAPVNANGICVLVIDDDPALLRSVEEFLKARGYGVHLASCGEDGLAILGREAIDIVVADVNMPGMDGFEVLRQVRQLSPTTEVIIITGYKESEQAFRALREGAFDFFTKPLNVQELKASLQRTIRYQQLQREKGRAEDRLQRIDQAAKTRYGLSTIVGESPATLRLREQVLQVAASDTTTVLVFGETGTGKELVARAIHVESARSSRPFVSVDCSAVPATLVESQFCGHEKGAFTDAREMHKGFLEQADGGTLFLDEVGDMDMAMQVRLLRVLEERCVRRIGGVREIPVDVRIISATNKDLDRAVKEGGFREDLYYRLNTFAVHVPALRERREDISVLANHFLTRFARESRKPISGLTSGALDALQSHTFPGNVRELRNLVERSVILCTTDRIRLEDIDLQPSQHLPASSAEGVSLPADPRDFTNEPDLTISRYEANLIREALRRTGGNRTRAADLLGISRKQLLSRIRKYDI